MFNYTINQLNSPFDDSAFFVRNVYRRKAFMFDCGRLGGLEHSDLLCVNDLFITHTHMDHFVGFDRILRGALSSDNTIRAFGPPGFINNVDGKFRGYTWNLVDEYSFNVQAVELHPDGRHKTAEFRSANRFVPELHDFPKGPIDISDGFTLTYEFFDHRTMSMGYRVSEPIMFSVDKDKLSAMGYREGVWLGELKKALKAGEKDRLIAATQNGETISKSAAQLESELIEVKKPQTITYITDISPTEANIEKAVRFASGSTLLIIEAVFTDEDIEHARKKNHLTLGISKDIFFKSGADMVRFTHFAARYEHDKARFMETLYSGMNGRVYTKNDR